MLYQAIREACRKYHPINGWDYDCALKAYREALKKRQESADYDNPSYEEAAILLSFANGWSSRMQCKVDDVHCALKEIQKDLDILKGENILDVCLDERNRELICRSFKVLASCNRKGRNEPTGTSKMLHIINPHLFVMWDTAIRGEYIVSGNWIQYTGFLRKVQQLAKQAVCEVLENEKTHSRETAIASLTGCKHSLAKALDEYNFMKYTKCCGSVWKAEDKSCNAPQIAH